MLTLKSVAFVPHQKAQPENTNYALLAHRPSTAALIARNITGLRAIEKSVRNFKLPKKQSELKPFYLITISIIMLLL